MAFVAHTALASASKRLLVIDTGELTSLSDYTASSELQEIRDGVTLGFIQAKILYPRCHLSVEDHIVIESQSQFQKRLSQIAEGLHNVKMGDVAVIGFSRSSNAQTVGAMFRSVPALGLSVGAGAELKDINSNFYSIAGPILFQWEKIKNIFSEQKCEKVWGYFPSTTALSLVYKNAFVKDIKNGELIEVADRVIPERDCIFFGSNFSSSIAGLRAFAKKNEKLVGVGTGDWALSNTELQSLLQNLASKVKIFSTIGWPQHGYKKNSRAQRIVGLRKTKSNTEPSPIFAYSYDAALLATSYLCLLRPPQALINDQQLKKYWVRDYNGVSEGQNLLSPYFLHEYTN